MNPALDAPPITENRSRRITRAALESAFAAQRAAHLDEGWVDADVRRRRVSRVALALLDNLDAIARSVADDHGPLSSRPTASDSAVWAQDVLDTLAGLPRWMEPEPGATGSVHRRPEGVIGVIAASGGSVAVAFEPVLAALAAGNRVMLRFPQDQPATGRLLADVYADAIDERIFFFADHEFAALDEFAGLPFDHLVALTPQSPGTSPITGHRALRDRFHGRDGFETFTRRLLVDEDRSPATRPRSDERAAERRLGACRDDLRAYIR